MTHIEFHEALNVEFGKHQGISSEIIKSVIELIDPVRTGRTSVDQLEKTEKTYIGTKVEIILRYILGLQKGTTQDCVLTGTEFDIKCTVRDNWMIPVEALNHYCLLVKIDWENKKICIGSFLALPENLSQGENRDKKKTLSKSGRETIKWIYEDHIFTTPEGLPYTEWKVAA